MNISELKEKGLLLFECISGSKAYGLDTAKSDTDIKGVFYLPKDQFYGLNQLEQVNNDSNDEVYYELGRYIDLLIKNNPNILEMLASPKECVLYKHPLMENLKPEYFLSQLCGETFAGYAMTQVKKAHGMEKKIVNPMSEKRQSLLDFCYVMQGYTSISIKNWLLQNNLQQEFCGLVKIPHSKGLYALFYDEKHTFHYHGIIKNELSNDVSLSSIPKGEKEIAYLYFNIESYSSYCKSYKAYWEWVNKRNQERYVGNREHGKAYDSKNMMHTIRLLQVAEELLRTSLLSVKRPNREELLDIKAGKWTYEELLSMSENLISEIKSSNKKSPLPPLPDRKKAEKILIDIRLELYK